MFTVLCICWKFPYQPFPTIDCFLLVVVFISEFGPFELFSSPKHVPHFSNVLFFSFLSCLTVQWNAKRVESRTQVKGTCWCASARIDGHEVAKTQTLEEPRYVFQLSALERSRNSFWSLLNINDIVFYREVWDESFQIMINEDLSLVSIYLHEHIKGIDSIIAKVRSMICYMFHEMCLLMSWSIMMTHSV